MAVVVEYQIREENTNIEEWLSVWNERAEDADVGEPETRAYAAAVNLDNDLNVLVFERYSEGDSSLKLHMQRAAHAALDQKMGDRKMSKRRVMSSMITEIPDCGWWGRPQTHSHNVSEAVFVVIGLRFETKKMQEDFIEMIKEHAYYCWENEPETLVYGFGIATKDADRELDLSKGDLVVILACSDTEALEKHNIDSNHIALGAKCIEKGIEIKSTFTRNYKTTGNGFLWRK